MGKRTRYIGGSQDETPILRGSWATHDVANKDENEDGADRLVFLTTTHSLALAQYNFETCFLAETKPLLPIGDASRPRTFAVHPTGDGVLVSIATGCQLFEWEQMSKAEYKSGKRALKLLALQRKLPGLEDIGPQNCIVFNGNGSVVCLGGDDGCIRVFRWPGMEPVINLPKAFKSIKDIDISYDSGFLSATGQGESTSCRVWDLTVSEEVATLNAEEGETFGFSRFSRDAKKAFLFVTVTKAKRGFIGVWNLQDWSRLGAKRFLPEPITALAVSHHGKRLAIGNGSGDVGVIEIAKMNLREKFKFVHEQGVSSLEFSPNNKAILSVSSDKTARVSAIDLSREWKDWQVFLVLIGLMLASVVLFYSLYRYGDSFAQRPRFVPDAGLPTEAGLSADELTSQTNHHEL